VRRKQVSLEMFDWAREKESKMPGAAFQCVAGVPGAIFVLR
jgi:hypothetical protein